MRGGASSWLNLRQSRSSLRRARLVALAAASTFAGSLAPIANPAPAVAAPPTSAECQIGFLDAAPPGAAECRGDGATEAPALAVPAGFQESVAWSGLTKPMALRFAADGRAFVAEKSGVIKIFDNLSDQTPTVFNDLLTNVHDYWDRGLLGLALDPSLTGGSGNGSWVYVLYAYDHPLSGGPVGQLADACPSPPGPTTDGCVISGRLSRFAVAGNLISGSEQVLIEDWCQQFPSHSLGSLNFGPDGALYVSSGDGASFNVVDHGQLGGTVPAGGPYPTSMNPCADPPGGAMAPPSAEGGALRSQDVRTLGGGGEPTSLDGSILRVDPVTGAGVPGNPFFSSSDPNARRIIATGLRNPFRTTFRPGTNELWVGDVGWVTWEELNRIPNATDAIADNFGWPCYEGNAPQPGYDGTNLTLCEGLYAQGPGAHAAPFYTYNHDANVVAGDGCPIGSSSISGLAFYPESGGSYPASYNGGLFFADYSRKCIWFMPRGSNGQPDPALRQTFVTAAGGAVDLAIGPGGILYYPNFDSGTIRRVTATGGNQPPTALLQATPTSGPVPLTVQFNGSGSSDPEGTPLTFAWDLDGDGAYDDATGVTASWTYTSPGNVTTRLRVTDAGSATGTATRVIGAGNDPPVPVISAPTAGTVWSVGDLISISGSASDAQDGNLPASALSWALVQQHCPSNCHSHQVQTWNGVATGQFNAPDHEYPSYLDLTLTATDSIGTQASTTRRLDPRTVVLSFATAPTGLSLVVNPTPSAAPFSRTVIIGSSNSVTATSPQTLGSSTYTFVSWSDGGAQSHQVVAPATNATYTATFQTSSLVTYASDTFTRTVVNSWGSATPTGGAYTLSGTAADFDVTGSAGTLNMPAGTSRTAALASVSARDIELNFRFATNKTPTGGSHHVYGIARRINATNAYRIIVRIATNGQVFVQASQVIANAETGIGSAVLVPGLTHTPGSFIRVRAQLSGTNPTTIRIRAWAEAGTEPATWQYTGTNSAASLQTAGGVGLMSYLGGTTTNAPVLVTFDDLLVTSIGGPPVNTAPVIDTVTISPSSPTTNQTLTATVTSHDAEGGTLTNSYQWTRNGTDIAGATSATLNLATAGNGDTGDLIRVRVTVSDGSLSSAPVTSSPVTVVNTAPTATVSLSPASPTTNATLTATATKNDADANPVSLTFVWKVNGTTVRTFTSPTALVDTLNLSVAGNGDPGQVVSVEVTPNDGTLNGTMVSASVTVAASANQAPVFSTDFFNRSDSEGNTVSLDADATDPDVGDTLVYSATGLPGGISINSSTGVISGTLSPTSSGVHSVVITVSDGSLTDTDSLTWTVADANQAPVFSTDITNQSNTEGQAVSLDADATDADLDTLVYSATGLPSGVTINSSTGVISGTLSLTSAGVHSIVVTVSDGTDTDTDGFTWTVVNANQAPVFSTDITDQSNTEGQAVSLDADATDADLDTLAYSATGLPNGVTINASTGVISGTLSLSSAGVHSVVVTVSDGGLTDTDPFTWTVANLNQAPTATVSLSPASPTTNATLTATATKNDADANPVSLTFVWKVNGTTVRTFTSPTALVDTLNLSVAGNGDPGQVVSVEVTPNDGTVNGTMVSASVTVAASANQAPVFSTDFFNRSDSEGNTVSLDADATDPDVGDTLVYSATGLPGGISINSSTGVISGTLSPTSSGVHSVVITVSDGSLTDTDSLTWTVADANQAPVFSTDITNQSNTEGQAVSLDADATDADLDTLVYSATGLPSGVTINSSTGVISGTLSLTSAGVHSIVVTVSDGTDTDTDGFTWTVANANQAPVFSTDITDQSNTEGNTVSLDADATDADLDTLTYSATGLPNGVTINASTGVISGTLSLSSAGVHSVVVTVSDGGLTDTDPFTWTVANLNQAPTATVSLSPASPTTNATLTATATKNDADANPVSLTFVWKVNGTTVRTFTSPTALVDTLNLSVAGNGDPGQVVSVEVTPNDGTLNGTMVSASVTVASSLVTYASDTFTRTVVNNWGSATPTGGAYTLSGTAADFDVTGSAGTLNMPAGTSRTAALASVSARDIELNFRFATNKTPTGGSHHVYGIARRINATNAYRIIVRIATNGQVFVQASQVIANAETGIGSAVLVPGLTHTPGSFIRVRAQLSGTNPTTIRIRAWAEAGTEPATWQYTGTNSAAALQAAGGVGLMSYLGSATTNAPVIVTLDDLLVTSIP